jgi:hypothetical protein
MSPSPWEISVITDGEYPKRSVSFYAFSQTAAAKKGPLRGSLKSRPHSIYRALHGRRAEHSLSGSPERQL